MSVSDLPPAYLRRPLVYSHNNDPNVCESCGSPIPFGKEFCTDHRPTVEEAYQF